MISTPLKIDGEQSVYILYPGNTIGENFVCGHYVLIRENNTIGNNVRIGSYTEISHHVTIEDGASLHSKCFIPEYTRIKRKAWIGPCCTIVNDLHPQTDGKHRKGIIIGEGAIIGANSTIMANVGKNAIVGAGSVIVEPVPPGEVWAGNRGQFKKRREDIDAYKISKSKG